jgi:Fic family protein
MTTERGNTCKILREKNGASDKAKNQLKEFNRMKKAILELFQNEELTVKELAEKLQIPEHEAMYQVLSLVKFGYLQTAGIDDMDEYYSYKIKEK